MVKYRDPEEIKRSYQEIKDTYSKKKGSWAIRDKKIFAYLKEHFKPEAQILDVGCSNGYFADKLLSNGYRNINLVDIGNYLTFPEVINLNRLNLLDLNFETLPYPENYFDLVCAFQVLEHLENPFHFMRECKRVLKPGGTLLLSIPNIFTLKSRLKFLLFGNLVGYNLINDHISLFTKDIFEKCFLKDFKLEKTKFYSPISRLAFLKGLAKDLFAVKICYVLKKK